MQRRIPAIAQFGGNTDRRGIFWAMLDIDCLSGSCLLGWLSGREKKSLFLVILLKGKDASAASTPNFSRLLLSLSRGREMSEGTRQ